MVPKGMKALVIHGKKDYRVETLPIPEPGYGEILVKVEAVGICAGDAKTFSGAERFWGNGSDLPAYVEVGTIPGHEFSGRVVALGDQAGEIHQVDVGDLVVSEQIVPCQSCEYCKTGNYQVCDPHHVYGFHKVTNGAMAEYMIYPKNALVHKVPTEVDPFHAAFVEPLACSLHCVELGNIQWNDVVVVSGCGPLGLGMVAGAKLKQPKCLIALDLFDWKLDIAKKAGADVVLNPKKCDLKKEIQALTRGLGCNVYLNATGAGGSVRQGLDIIKKLGTFVEFSVYEGPISADWSIIGDVKEITIKGGHLGPNCWPKAIEMISQKVLPVEDIITHKFPIRDWRQGIDKVIGSTDSVKVMLIPNQFD